MKLIAKIFLCATLVVSLALSFLGYFLIARSFDDAIARERTQMISRYRFTCFTIQAQRLSNGTDQTFYERLERMSNGGYISVSIDGKKAYSNFPGGAAQETAGDDVVSQIVPYAGGWLLEVTGAFTQIGQRVSVCTAQDVTNLVTSVRQMQQSYRRIYLAAWSAAAVLLLILTRALTRPLGALSTSAQAVAQGDYSRRVKTRSRDELGALAQSFNQMAAQIEKNVDDLEASVQQKERFVANFAHELKTPLTSVIGYADMIYQRDLGREDTRAAASYILGEGLRLEALSLKLMDMIVLDKQDFILEWLNARELFDNIVETLVPLCRKKGVRLSRSIDEGYVRVEFDLFKTMILNLVDNSVKANAKNIYLIARKNGDKMDVHILDDGMGIKQEELAKITEAFYMVDKSRSRKQHGAGLGLALCERIARVHGSELNVTSQYGEGSCVHLSLEYADEEE